MKKAILFLCMFLITGTVTKAIRNDYPNISTTIFTTDHGLSSTKITSITQDEKGFIWIGTEDGLNKFDGYRFWIYKKKENDSLSLNSDHITALYVDSNQRLWVGTMGGLHFYESRSDSFVRANLNQPDYVIKDSQCQCIKEDKDGSLWISASGLGVLCYSPLTGQSVLHTPSHTQPATSLCSSHIRCIEEDKEGNIWLGSEDKGLSIYNPKNHTFLNLTTQNSNLPSNAVFSLRQLEDGNMLISTIGGGVVIYDRKTKQFNTFPEVFNTISTRSAFYAMQDKKGNILAGTEGSGLLVFDPINKKLHRHPVFNEYLQEIGDTKVHLIYEDIHGHLWISMNYKGLGLIKNQHNGFRHYRRIGNNPNSLSYDHVMGMTTDKQGNIWIATDGGGINRYNPMTDQYTHYQHKENDPATIRDNAVVSVFCDNQNQIWAGTYTGGLSRFNRNSHTFTTYMATGQPDGLHANFIKCIVEDSKGYLWLGTNGGGLTRMNPQNETFRTFRVEDYRGLANDYITTLFIDSRNHLWIGTYFGLSRMNTETEVFTLFGATEGLSDQGIYSITEDGTGTIWVGTQNGLNRYIPEENRFNKEFPSKTSTYSSVINGLAAHKDQLWLSTNNGVICYWPKSGTARHYDQHTGLGNTEFILASYHKSAQNEIFFGGVDGMSAFHPDHIDLKNITPPAYITGLRIANQPVRINEEVNGKVILTENITESKKLKLNHTVKSFTLEFTALEAPEPLSLIYACRMEGFNDQWIEYDNNRRFATFTNLNPGTYKFQVKATNNREIWGDEYTSLIITILPPIWATWWAKIGYGFILLLVVYIILKMMFIRVKDKNELRIERLKLKQQEEINQLKTSFFTNISHEFRTPLTLIISPLESMLATETDPEKKQMQQLMLRNAQRLLHLINQLLEVNKVEEGKMQLKVQPLDLISFVSSVINSFREVARKKQVELIYTYYAADCKIWYDPDMLDKFLTNILANALKFTSAGDQIEIHIQEIDEENLALSISDTGIGMDKETMEHVFDRFYQKDNKKIGTGIGMHLTKSIIELHHGSITVQSQEGKGTTFYIQILKGETHFKPDEKVYEEFKPSYATVIKEQEPDLRQKEINLKIQPQQPVEKKKEKDKLEQLLSPTSFHGTLLVIEDDEDMRQYIREELEDTYRIEEATNGKDGLEKARKQMPDLIITDIMMPEVNGIELCRTLKTDPETSHIPIIILTAQGDQERRLEGLETGADSYISKPFNIKHLKIRIEKLIELRKNMKDRFSKSLNMEAQEITLTSTDERLLQNAINYVRKHMESPDMSVEGMSKELGLSRTHLHRKLKALTGQSPVEFIKTIRMKQAAYLLSTGKLSISEVGYKVGYNTPSYFSSSFSSHFGMPPSIYMEQAEAKRKEGAGK
ncbi:MAG: response regulator [Tannerellaceae bacterium]|nr:response regulator [Tannerellaceae bacterium]